MEPEQQAPLYIYNPYVLALLHSKTQYMGLLREYHAACGDGDEARLLIRDNLYDCALVADVAHLARLLADHEFPLDLYLAANYEYALYRLLMLCQPPTELLPPQCCADLGSPFVCDLKCQVLLERDAADQTRFRAALRRYMALQYFEATTLRDYERVAQARATMLLQVKQSAERAEAVRRAPDYDFCVRYNKELHQTMLYLCLLNELLAQDELTAHDAKLTPLLQQLYDTLRQHYESEFRGNAVTTEARGSIGDDAHFACYVRTGCVWQQVSEVRTQGEGFTVPTRDARNLRYLALHRNLAHYEYAVRRFALDWELQRLHTQYCPRLTARGKNAPCHTCHYRARSESLMQFYEVCERYAYNAPEYDGANEQRLHAYLSQALLPLVPRVDGIFYKNLWQLQRLFALEPPLQLCIPTQRPLPLETRVSSLFQALDLVTLMHDLRLQYGDAEGGPEARVTTLLAQQRPHFSTRASSTAGQKWQMRLALDTDAVLCVLRALAEQQAAVEKCERAITSAQQQGTPRHDSLDSQRQFFSALRGAVTRAYALYVQELRDALG